MPPPSPSQPSKTLEQVVREVDRYPIEAFHFVHQGLGFTVEKLRSQTAADTAARHVNGQELSTGLREFALQRWGLLARVVLHTWAIHGTVDFGRIVFAMVDHGLLAKTPGDQLKDFEDVYDFRQAFEREYRVPVSALDQPREVNA